MKYALIVCILFFVIFANGQSDGDKKIIITVTDSSGIYDIVKIALVKSDFIVKEDGNKETLLTYPREFKKMAGFAIAKAEIKGTTITLSGQYGLSRVTSISYTTTPKSYKPIIYFKGSKGWLVLMQVADIIGGQVSYDH